MMLVDYFKGPFVVWHRPIFFISAESPSPRHPQHEAISNLHHRGARRHVDGGVRQVQALLVRAGQLHVPGQDSGQCSLGRGHGQGLRRPRDGRLLRPELQGVLPVQEDVPSLHPLQGH
ncbi:hypothetical protein CH63R_06441 [Colletotrichum higginsianum IMI 349063]|uniref:Uncharacterized protein n=1 Tax=Colletotrichum higginsianum (strain IMI 349063) TaxID=759273 RepID=A0A1B7YFC5_COLHI|nr:hypothetical protein CH63R_06441 [Colletotrichum higginsianum IMI 349063]OBR10749.1 hypothetical protein CH63R_06441 [Colletotrichum higginsianum IMI 349063]